MSLVLQRLWRSPWMRTLSLAIISATLLGLMVATTVRHLGVVLLPYLYILPVVVPLVAGVILVTWIWWAWRRSPVAMKIVRYSTAILLFLGVNCGVSAWAVIMIADSDREAAMAYCETIIPHIERYADEQGDYPDHLSQIQDLPSHPAGGAKCAYNRSDDGYALKLSHRSNYMGNSFTFHQVP